MFYADKKAMERAREEIRRINFKNVIIENRGLTTSSEWKEIPRDDKNYKTGISVARLSATKGADLIY